MMDMLKKFATIHRTIAAAMGDGKLRCRKCGKSEDLSADQVEKYLSVGWPMCCATTMGYEGPTPGAPGTRPIETFYLGTRPKLRKPH